MMQDLDQSPLLVGVAWKARDEPVQPGEAMTVAGPLAEPRRDGSHVLVARGRAEERDEAAGLLRARGHDLPQGVAQVFRDAGKGELQGTAKIRRDVGAKGEQLFVVALGRLLGQIGSQRACRGPGERWDPTDRGRPAPLPWSSAVDAEARGRRARGSWPPRARATWVARAIGAARRCASRRSASARCAQASGQARSRGACRAG